MKIISIEIDNIFQFKDFKIDFTHPRKVSNPYNNEEKNEVSGININDVNIIIGANATGKSALSKVILLGRELIRGENIYFRFSNITNLEFNAIVKIEYLVNDGSADYYIKHHFEFNNKFLAYENISYAILKKNNSYKNIDYKLLKEYIYDEDDYTSETIVSQLVNVNIYSDRSNKVIIHLLKNNGYTITNSNGKTPFTKHAQSNYTMINIESFLKQIDSRISHLSKIEDLFENNNESLAFYIHFSNGSKEYFDLSNEKTFSLLNDKLSTGTIEAFRLFLKIQNIKSGFYNTIYIDEQLSHVHYQLEKELLSLLIGNLPNTSQLFYTTHNVEILKMNIPLVFFTIMYKDSEGYIRSIKPSEYLKNRNDRNELFNKIEEDYFNTYIDFNFNYE